MSETWLRFNRRPLLLELLFPCVLLGLTGAVALGLWEFANVTWLRIVCGVFALLALLPVAGIVDRLIHPLLAYRDGELVVYLVQGKPVRVPIKLVEGFLIGRDEVELGGLGRVETHTLVVRIAEKATEFAEYQVNPNFGRWCGGYINIRGTWCEPLSVDLVNRLNQRLVDVQKAFAAQGAK